MPAESGLVNWRLGWHTESMEKQPTEDPIVEVIAQAIQRSFSDTEDDFLAAWADVEVIRQNRLIEARAVINALFTKGYRILPPDKAAPCPT